jgi:hypothetical protein
MNTAQTTSSAINYASSIKSKITTALELQDGLNAIKHYERMGLITFGNDKPIDGRVRSGKTVCAKEVDGRRKIALKCMHYLSQGSTIVKQAKDLGLTVSQLQSWMRKYAGYKGKNQLTGN